MKQISLKMHKIHVPKHLRLERALMAVFLVTLLSSSLALQSYHNHRATTKVAARVAIAQDKRASNTQAVSTTQPVTDTPAPQSQTPAGLNTTASTPQPSSDLQKNNEYANPRIQYNRNLTCPTSITYHRTQGGYWQGQNQSWQIANMENDPMHPRTIQGNNLYFMAGQSSPGTSTTSASWPASLTTYNGPDYTGQTFDFPIEMYGISGRIYSCTVHVDFINDYPDAPNPPPFQQ